jgi:hypothetical protein
LNVGGISPRCERTIARLAGEAVLEITNGEAGVPEELLDEVKSVAGVSAAEASVQGFVPVLDHEGERLYIVGLDLLAEQQLWSYQLIDAEGAIEDPLVFLAQPDSVAVTNDFLTANGLTLGDRIRVRGPRGPVWLSTRGALDLRSGRATLFGWRLAVMDVFAAQRTPPVSSGGNLDVQDTVEAQSSCDRLIGVRSCECPLFSLGQH